MFFGFLDDADVEQWMSVGSVPMLNIVLGYIVFVKWAGPKLMESRDPLHLKKFLIFYNAFQVLWAIYVLLLVGRQLKHPSTQ